MTLDRFSIMIDRVRDLKHFDGKIAPNAPYGHFNNRPIIGEGAGVLGGIYLGPIAHEAIVVDEKYGFLLRAYAEFLKHFDFAERGYSDEEIIRIAAEFVSKKLVLSEDRVEKLREDKDLTPDQKVSLDLFLEYGYGAARHQVLLMAYLLEKLKDEQRLKGKVYLDSSYDDEALLGERLIFSSAEGNLFVLIPQ